MFYYGMCSVPNVQIYFIFYFFYFLNVLAVKSIYKAVEVPDVRVVTAGISVKWNV